MLRHWSKPSIQSQDLMNKFPPLVREILEVNRVMKFVIFRNKYSRQAQPLFRIRLCDHYMKSLNLGKSLLTAWSISFLFLSTVQNLSLVKVMQELSYSEKLVGSDWELPVNLNHSENFRHFLLTVFKILLYI